MKKGLIIGASLVAIAVLCMAVGFPVFVGNTANYWTNSGANISLMTSNSVAVITVNTGNQHVAIGDAATGGTAQSVVIQGFTPATGSASTTGGISVNSGNGGVSVATTTGTGGAAGQILVQGGTGGNALLAQTNSTGGIGAAINAVAGQGGGNAAGAATNASIGGAGGPFNATGGAGGVPVTASTNAVGGNGGGGSVSGGAGGTPTAGWARKGGVGGLVNMTGGQGGTGVRTNAGKGGDATILAGDGGNAATTPAHPGIAGIVTITAGNGGTGDTNAFGGDVFAVGGAGGGGAAAGNVILAVVQSTAAARGLVGVGTNTPRANLHVQGSIAASGSGQQAVLAAAPTNNVLTTNWFGRVERLFGSVMEAAFNQFSELVVTNRATGVSTITLTNGTPGYSEMQIEMPGEVAGGTSRVITLVANTGQLIANLDTFGTALATSYAFTLTNGNAVVISDKLRQLNGTNVHMIVTRQFAF
jgi:hypothetical protein